MTEITFRSDVEVQLIRSNMTDEDVAHAAWVSTKGQDAEKFEDPARVPGLINYLIRNRHMSPLEHGQFTFFIRCPIFVIREFHRHRTWSYNEESGRYSKLKPEFYVPDAARPLVQEGKPGEYIFVPGDDHQYEMLVQGNQRSVELAWNEYERMLSAGVAKEVARMHLPLSIYSSFYATVNPRNLMAFLSLRTQNEEAAIRSTPQHEIQMVADKIELEFARVMPVTHEAWHRNGRQ